MRKKNQYLIIIGIAILLLVVYARSIVPMRIYADPDSTLTFTVEPTEGALPLSVKMTAQLTPPKEGIYIEFRMKRPDGRSGVWKSEVTNVDGVASDTSKITSLEGGVGTYLFWAQSGEVISNAITVVVHERGWISPPTVEPQPPSEPSIWLKLQDFFSGIFSWIRTVLGLQLFQPLTVMRPGQTFTATIMLTNTRSVVVPDSDWSDGSTSYLYKTYVIYDPGGNVVYKGSLDMVVQLSPNEPTYVAISYPIPSNAVDGRYAGVALLIEVPLKWDDVSASWITQPPVIIDKQAEFFEVQAITPPSPPEAPTVWQSISNLLGNLLNWLRNLFGF